MLIKDCKTHNTWKALGITPEHARHIYVDTAVETSNFIANTASQGDPDGEGGLYLNDLLIPLWERYNTEEERLFCAVLISQHISAINNPFSIGRVLDTGLKFAEQVRKGDYKANSPELRQAIWDYVWPQTANVIEDEDIQNAEVVSGPDQEQKLIPEKV